MPQVASDPKIHAQSHALARQNRPAQQSDSAPSPFESLLDDGAAPPDQPAPPAPETKTAPTDSSQAPAKTQDSKPVVANDNGTVKQADNADPLDKPEDGVKTTNPKQVVVDAKLLDGAATDTTKPADDGKPADGAKTDSTAAATPVDPTIVVTDKITVAPVVAPVVQADTGDQGKQASQQVELTADATLSLKAVEPGPAKTAGGKQTATDKPVDGDAPVDPDPSADASAGDAQLTAKPAGQAHTDKPQLTLSDNDKQHISQARGEAQATSDRPAADAKVALSADAGSAPANTGDTPAQPALQAASTNASAPTTPQAADLNPPATLQAAPVPLNGIAVEIAGKALAGKNRFEIRLDPPELGRIEVRLDVDRNGNVTSRLTVDRADTLDLLRRDASGLERALQDAGLKTGDNGLQFSLRDQSMSQQQTNNGPDPSAAQLVVNDDTLPSTDINLSNYGRLAGQGSGLDIRV